MEIPEAVRFVAANHRAVLATRRGDGRPQLSPVTVGVDDAGRVVISTRETALKVRNIERDPVVSVCIFADSFFGDWVQIDGQAAIVHLPEAMDLLIAYYRDIAGEHPDWDDYRAAMERDRRVIVRITPERAGPNRAG